MSKTKKPITRKSFQQNMEASVPRQPAPKQEIVTTPKKLVDEGRKQSHYIIDTLTKTAMTLAGSEGASDKVAVIERLWAMQKEAEDRQQEREFAIAKVALAMELPAIPKRKMIEFIDKNNVKRETPYADRGDIESVLEPLCQRHGLTKEYSTETIEGKACQVLTVRHVGGHKEVYRSPYMPLDSTGSKNNNQAAGSTSEYGKRYALIGAFNIIGVDKDDDGNLGKDPTAKGEDKFTSRVNQESAKQPDPTAEAGKLSVEEAATTLEQKLRNEPDKGKRGEILMKNVKIIGALDDAGMTERAAAIRQLAEEAA